MKCLYETLAVERKATDDEIKKAYRKQALLWHPDKNQHRKEEAEAEFKAIQNAYEILSDKHERAWYDSHREAILKSGNHHQAGGSSGGEASGKPDDGFDIYEYCTTSCHTGHHDGIKGFYSVYSEAFQNIAEAEMRAFDLADEDDEEAPGPFPDFGTSTSDKETVMGFHAFWANFVTIRSFTWADIHNPASAPNRRVRRAMEDENRKLRKAARKDYIDEIRHFASYVKKRDKRVAKFQKEEEERKAAKKREMELLREKQLEEKRQRAREYKDASWIVEGEESAESESSLEEVDEYLCVACDKTFKSQEAFENHERSKKHQKKLAELRECLEAEDELNPDGVGEGQSEKCEDSSPSLVMEGKKSKKKKKARQKKGFAMQEELRDSEEEGGVQVEDQGSGETHEDDGEGDSRKVDLESEDNGEEEEGDMDDEDAILARLVARQGTSGGAKQQSSSKLSVSNSCSDAESEVVSPVCGESGGHHGDGQLEGDEEEDVVSRDGDGGLGGEGCGEGNAASVKGVTIDDGKEAVSRPQHRRKAKSKKKGSEEKMGSNESKENVGGRARTKKGKGRQKNSVEKSDVEVLRCRTCDEEFDSRNQLFKHIKDTKHGVWK